MEAMQAMQEGQDRSEHAEAPRESGKGGAEQASQAQGSARAETRAPSPVDRPNQRNLGDGCAEGSGLDSVGARRFTAADFGDRYGAEVGGVEILEAVHTWTGISPDIVLSRARMQAPCDARRVVCFLLRVRAGWTLAAIGRLMNRDHTSAWHHVAAARKKQQGDARYARMLEECWGMAVRARLAQMGETQ